MNKSLLWPYILTQLNKLSFSIYIIYIIDKLYVYTLGGYTYLKGGVKCLNIADGLL